MRLVFMGTPSAAVPSLRALVDAGHDVRLVVTQPDRAVGRSRRLQPPPVKVAAHALGIETAQPEKVRTDAFLEGIASHEPEALVVVAYGRLLGRPLIEWPRLGAINAHFSLLPRYRGAAPVQWALARGEARTGVTTMRVVEELDAGPILLQRETAIELDEHAPALEARLAELAAELLVATLAGLASGQIAPREQEARDVTFAPRLSRADAAIGLDLPASDIEGRIRGFDPWPGVWVRCRDRRVRLLRGRAVALERAAEPGAVLETHAQGVLVACAPGTALLVRALQVDGGRPLLAADAVNGRVLAPGDRLEPIGASA